MKKLVIMVLLGLFITSIPFIPVATGVANAQFVDPEELFEDNPARVGEAIEQGKVIVPDISALGIPR